MAFLDKTGLERLWAQILTKLSTKVDKVEGKGLSTNDYTIEDKNKLDSIDTNAIVSSVNGQTNVVTLTAEDINAISTLTGGTSVGNIIVERSDGTSVIVSVTNGTDKINLQVSDSGNKGIYNSTLAKWLVYANSDNEVRVNNTTQTITSACLRNIKSGTAALTAGSSELASGEIYIQFE